MPLKQSPNGPSLFVTVGLAFSDINWLSVVSVSMVAGIYSLLMSIAGLPEVGTDGVLQIDTSHSETDIYRFAMNTPLSDLSAKKKVTLAIDSTADLTET